MKPIAGQMPRGSGRDYQPDIQPIGAGDWVRWMLYAFPGWGKTSIVGTAAEVGRTLIVHSSMDLMPARIMKQPNLDQVTADTWEKMDEVLEYCRMTRDFPYDWVWWDCVSIAQDVLLDDVWESTIALYPHRNNKTIKGGLDRGEYGRNMDMEMRWVRHMVGANRFHFGITAHPWEGPHPTNDEGGTLLQPWIQGKQMIPKTCGYMNMVSFLEVKENDKETWRRLHFKENSRFYAKDQYDAFLPRGYLDIRDDERGTVPKLMQAVEKARGRGLGNQAGTTGRRRGAPTTTTARPRRGSRA